MSGSCTTAPSPLSPSPRPCRSCLPLCHSCPGGERRLRGPGTAASAAAQLPAHPPARHQRLPHGQVRAGPLPGKVGGPAVGSLPRQAASFRGVLGAPIVAEQLGSGSLRRLCLAAPRIIPLGSDPASARGMPQGARGAGSGAAAVLQGAGRRLPPSPWVPVVSRGQGDPAEVIGERPAEPSWTPDAGQIPKRWGGRPGRFAPGTPAPSLVALPPSSSSSFPIFAVCFPVPGIPNDSAGAGSCSQPRRGAGIPGAAGTA